MAKGEDPVKSHVKPGELPTLSLSGANVGVETLDFWAQEWRIIWSEFPYIQRCVW